MERWLEKKHNSCIYRSKEGIWYGKLLFAQKQWGLIGMVKDYNGNSTNIIKLKLILQI